MTSFGGVKIGVIKLTLEEDDVEFNRIISRDYIKDNKITDDHLYYFVEEFNNLFPDKESLDIFVLDQGLQKDGGFVPAVATLALRSKGLWVQIDYFEDNITENIVMSIFHNKDVVREYS